GYWGDHDPKSIKFKEGNPFRNAIVDYYRYIDGKIGEVLEAIDEETAVMIVSDHGAQRVDGCIVINEWLAKEGYLTVKSETDGIKDITLADVDWKHTKAWAWGGYYSSVFLNVLGREENGVIPPEDYEKVRDELAEKLRNIADDKGNAMKNTVIKPDQYYRNCERTPPDLIACFGDLHWEPISTMGHNKTHLVDPSLTDEANHAWQGVFLLYDPTSQTEKALGEISIYDVAPTILGVMGLETPATLKGENLAENKG
ncbi:alkaline phosphatase family protein, partial [archaeon]